MTQKKDRQHIRPYGDHWNDGKIQLSFTLPISAGEKAKEAARIYLEKIGFEQPQIVSMEGMGEGYSFFVAYGTATFFIDLDHIKTHKPEFPILPYEELSKLAKENFRKKIVIVGGTIGSDAHTVGIDAILSIKGIAGDKGLEYYPIFQVVNLRAQVSNEVLLRKAAELGAEAILVSQFVTQQDQHLDNLRSLNKAIKKETNLSPHLLKIVGGPRMDHRIAKSVGFDAGFGPGTKPSEVANYIVHELIRRHQGHGSSQKEKPRSLLGWLAGK